MPTAAIGDLDMFYREQGSGDPVLLIHGNTASSLWWEYTLQRMGDAYHFIAPDLRGRGDTDGPAADWTIETLSNDVRGLLEHLGIGAAHWVGHSLGSDVALQYALDHHADVKSLTLLNPGWVAGDMPAAIGDPSRIEAMLANKDLLKMALRAIAIKHPDNADWKRLEAASLQQKDEASLRSPAALMEWAVADRLHELAGIPTLIARGADDQFISTKAVCQTILDNLPGARYVEIPGASHSANIETPDAWVAVLREHLASVK
jgi:pimeloyl-ACP methyl ester carboxylesterase